MWPAPTPKPAVGGMTQIEEPDMGHLFYGNTTEPFDIPDRLLAHVKVVAATKLRRSESFTLSWQHRPDDAAGRTTLWMQPSIPLRFVFDEAESEIARPRSPQASRRRSEHVGRPDDRPRRTDRKSRMTLVSAA